MSDNFNTPIGGDDDWGDYDMSNQSETSQDDWGTSPQYDNPDADNWDTTSYSDETDSDESGNFASFDDNADENPDSYWEQQESFTQNDNPQVQNQQPIERKKLGYKGTGLVVGGAFILLALILMVMGKAKINKKPQQTTSQTQQQVTEAPANTAQSSEQAQPAQANDGSVMLQSVAENITLDYSGDVLSANGKISNKLRFTQGNQVIYCLEVTIAVGTSSETVRYYCNFATYNAVSKGDLVVVKYQQIQDSYISVNEITK